MTLLGEMKMQEETRRKPSLKWFILVILFVIIDVWCLYNSFSGFILQLFKHLCTRRPVLQHPDLT